MGCERSIDTMAMAPMLDVRRPNTRILLTSLPGDYGVNSKDEWAIFASPRRTAKYYNIILLRNIRER